MTSAYSSKIVLTSCRSMGSHLLHPRDWLSWECYVPGLEHSVLTAEIEGLAGSTPFQGFWSCWAGQPSTVPPAPLEGGPHLFKNQQIGNYLSHLCIAYHSFGRDLNCPSGKVLQHHSHPPRARTEIPISACSHDPCVTQWLAISSTITCTQQLQTGSDFTNPFPHLHPKGVS